MKRPLFIILSGPNGSGKSTSAPSLLQGTLGVSEFVNADVIARGISGFDPEKAAIQAGRVMIQRLYHLSNHKMNFAFETTLASRSLVNQVERLKELFGYHSHLIYLWLNSPDLALERVAERVRLGGHDIPEDVIRRRYKAGLKNFFNLYCDLCDGWHFYDNSSSGFPVMIAKRDTPNGVIVYNKDLWDCIREKYCEI